MTTLGSRQYDGTLNGRGHQTNRNGVPTPMHYNPVRGGILINAGKATTGWSAAAGCSVGMANVVTPEGRTESLLKVTGTGDNTTAFFDCTTAPLNGAQLGKYGLEFDLYYQTGEPYSQLGSSGTQLNLAFTDFTNAVTAIIQLRQEWQHVVLMKADFSNVAGSGAWDTTAFAALRFRLAAKANVTHIVWIRNLSYVGGR